MEYVKKLTEKVVQEILSQAVRDMPQNPGAQGYTERQIRQYFYVPEEKILRLIQEVETAIAQAVEDLEGSGTLVVDKALSNMSTNPVQNMVITDALGTKVDYETLGQAVNSLRQEHKEYTDTMFNGANKSISYVNYSSMIQFLNSLILTDGGSPYNVGQNIMIVTLEVPDLWVSEIVAEHIDYQYVSDTDVIEELKANGSVQVGNYKLSALETQKVDLTEYEKTADVDEKLSGKVNKSTTSGNRVYGHTSAVQKEFNVSQTPNPYALPMFNHVTDENLGDKIPDTQQGTISVANPRYKKQVVNKEYVDTGMWLPAYDETATYSKGNMVVSGGIIYKSLIDNNTGNALTDTAAWEDLLNGKVSKTKEKKNAVYGISAQGERLWNVEMYPFPYQIPFFVPVKDSIGSSELAANQQGTIVVAMPQQPYHTANKKYVDEAVANTGKLYRHIIQLSNSDLYLGITYEFISSKSAAYTQEEFIDYCNYSDKLGIFGSMETATVPVCFNLNLETLYINGTTVNDSNNVVPISYRISYHYSDTVLEL
jgi:hypothetical protein